MAPAATGTAFTSAADGDMRAAGDRVAFSADLGIAPAWAMVHQVHGCDTIEVDGPGVAGAADAVLTSEPGLPVAVLTADCLGIVLHGERMVAAVHAGWRGLAGGVVEAAGLAMAEAGSPVSTAQLGPSIGPCCYEVGPEVVAAIGTPSATTWGTVSVDLRAAARRRLEQVAPGIEVSIDDRCTRCSPGLYSHRRDGTAHRLAAVGWL
jgi:YfiH family protein